MEILYCAGCQTMVTGADLDLGRAFRSGDRVLCRACAPAELAAAAAKAPPAAARRPGSSSSHPKMGTTRRAAVPEAPARRPSPLVVGGIAGAVLLVGLVVLMAGRSGPPPSPPVRNDRPPAPPPRDRGPDPRLAAQWSTLETQSRQACDREEFGQAVELLEKAIRNSPDPDWAALVGKRVLEVRGRALSLFADLSAQALAAKKKGADPEAASIAARVAAWNLPECRIVFEEKPPAPPTPPPAPPPAPAPHPPQSAPMAIYDGGLDSGWQDWSFSTQRNFQARAPGLEGKQALSAIFERNGAGLYFHSTKGLEGSSFSALEFSVRTEGDPISLIVTLADDQNHFLDAVSLGTQGGHPPPGRWKHYEISMAALQGEGKKLAGINIQAVGKVVPSTVYFDGIRLRPAR